MTQTENDLTKEPFKDAAVLWCKSCLYPTTHIFVRTNAITIKLTISTELIWKCRTCNTERRYGLEG